MSLRNTLGSIVKSFGYELLRKDDGLHEPAGPGGIVAVDMRREFAKIPGMIHPELAMTLYLVAYALPIEGDVVEVGCYVGRTTCFLASACRDSGNGVVHAIDHFRGNPGKGSRYELGRPLEDVFRDNVAATELEPWVRLHAGHVTDAEIEGPVRFLLVDSEHTYDAVLRDVDLFAHLIPTGGIIVFDDYRPQFPGVVEAVRTFCEGDDWGPPVVFDGMVMVRRT